MTRPFLAAINSTATFSFKAWDRTSGVFGTKATTLVGTAFSTAVDVATLLVNNAPVLNF
jgi:hypothetical protein